MSPKTKMQDVPRRPLVPRLKTLASGEAFGGILLVLCTVLALAAMNAPWATIYQGIWEIPIRWQFAGLSFDKDLLLVINDGLMTLFFFTIGLEIKRECIHGELQRLRSASLPAIAALGGMLVPVALFKFILPIGPGSAGWGIPMATDIAFVVGFLSLLGARVPRGLKILVLSLAIVDDLGAVLVIAIFYTQSIALNPLLLASIGFGLILGSQIMGVRSIAWYTCLGFAIWLAVLKSGVHPTVAGVLLGLLTPAQPLFAGPQQVKKGLQLRVQHLAEPLLPGSAYHHQLAAIAEYANESISPLERLEHRLAPWMRYLILPLFALANAGIVLGAAEWQGPLAYGVIAGLVLGKPLGIFSLSWLAVKLRLAVLPRGVTWRMLAAASVLCGVGFTMSIFIAGLGLEDSLLHQAKIGILLASSVSGLLGMILLLATLKQGLFSK